MKTEIAEVSIQLFICLVAFFAHNVLLISFNLKVLLIQVTVPHKKKEEAIAEVVFLMLRN